MGFFDLHCVESGLALEGPTAVLLIAKNGEQWLPCALPCIGTYDRFGGVDELWIDDAGEEILSAVARSLPNVEPDIALEDLLHELVRSTRGQWAGRDVSYTLIDAPVYHAAAETVRARPGYDDATLDAMAPSTLIAKAFPFPECLGLYRGIEAKSREALKELVRFRAWGTALRPVAEAASGQYCGFMPPSSMEGSAAFTLDLVKAARARYAGHPAILEAIEENADRWSELDAPAHRQQRARERGKPFLAPVRLERLLMMRSMTGEQVVELDVREAPLVARLLRERIVDHQESIHLESSACRLKVVPASTASWRHDFDEDCYVMEASPELAKELIEILLPSRSVSAELQSLPGLRVRT
jgi:hypothetical protein